MLCKKLPSLATAATAAGCALILLGVAARLYLAASTWGTNDIRAWEHFSHELAELGLVGIYPQDPHFNHPPMMGLYALTVGGLSNLTGVGFPLLFKLPMIAADCVAMFVVFRTWRPRSTLHGVGAAALYALNPASLAVSAYHGNTDPLCAMLCCVAAFLHDRKRPFLSGLALAGAINVKLIPVLLIPVLFLLWDSRRARLRFLLALALGALPFLPALLLVGDDFKAHAMEYTSNPRQWGIVMLLMQSEHIVPRFYSLLWGPFRHFGRYGVLAASVAIGVAGRGGRRFTAIQGSALCLSIFLILAPGFGIQYIVYPVALLFCCEVALGALYAYLAGTFACLLYFLFRTKTDPAFSDFKLHNYPDFVSSLGLLAWATLVAFVIHQLKRGAARPSLLAPSAPSAPSPPDAGETPRVPAATTAVPPLPLRDTP